MPLRSSISRFLPLVALGALAPIPAAVPALAVVGTCSPSWQVIAETSGPQLSDVAAISPTDVWMVGTSGQRGSTVPVAVHWDGRLLRRYLPFRPTQPGGGRLFRVSALSMTDVWAAGSEGDDRHARDVVVHWDGEHWRLLPAPPVPRHGYVYDFAATGSNSVWLVGSGARFNRPLLLHWNGQRWGQLNLGWHVAPPASDLEALAVRAPNDIWAVGAQNLAGESYGYTDLELHWNGRHWRALPATLEADNGGDYGIAVAVAPSGDIWTADQDLSGNPPVFVHFAPHGRKPVVFTPGIGFDPLDIEPVSATTGWVSGSSEFPSRSVLVYWDGDIWRVVHIPHGDLETEPVWSLSALSPTDVWAAGSRLLARYSC